MALVFSQPAGEGFGPSLGELDRWGGVHPTHRRTLVRKGRLASGGDQDGSVFQPSAMKNDSAKHTYQACPLNSEKLQKITLVGQEQPAG